MAGSFERMVAGMERHSFRQVIRQACIDGFVELRDERGFEHLLAAAKYGAASQSRQSATAAIGRLAVHFPERKRRTGEELAELLHDPDFRIRVAAAGALRAIGDNAQAGALDAMAGRELDGRAVRAAREAAITIRKGVDTIAEVKALRDDFEKLRDENQKLKDRLDRVEVAAPGR